MALTKKRATRKLCAQNAWITLDGGFAARPCLVEDISHSGVKITLDQDANNLPGVVHLAFSRDTRTGRRCQVVWRRGKSAGIKFV
ncbi:MAG: PilZ domain-containing protein [Alphaproteobacteria bacterium]|nr:PilZ domain-containing protein [Alphaproteobacteria bacterium]